MKTGPLHDACPSCGRKSILFTEGAGFIAWRCVPVSWPPCGWFRWQPTRPTYRMVFV